MSTFVERPEQVQEVDARPQAEVLQRADGIQLLGEFEDSGFKEPPRLVRRSDGQVVQLTELLYEVAHAADGERDLAEVADVVSDRFGRPVTPSNVQYLADRKLRPLGVIAQPDGSTPKLKKRQPVMALRCRRPLLPERFVNGGARLFTWLHSPAARLVVIALLVVFDIWLFGVHGVAGGLRAAIYNPVLMLAVLGSIVVATAFHEFGHASALRYGGGRPGVMGVGLYLVWPAFYCDVTDAYRLNRAARLRTDLGGVYFNLIFALAAGAVYFRTGQEVALLVAFVQHMTVLQQLLPLMRFDGYYVLTDLTGVPDILSRIGPIFRSLLPGSGPEPKVHDLKPWVRVVVTTYLTLLVPTLAFFIVWMTIGFPRLVATFWDSLGLQLDRLHAAAQAPAITLGVVNLVMLALPIGGTLLSLSRSGRMVGRGLHRWAGDSHPRRALAVLAGAALVSAIAYTWWPNGDYAPIKPGERGTVGSALRSMGAIPSGRPSFTPAQQAYYAHVPSERQIDAAKRAGVPIDEKQLDQAVQQGEPYELPDGSSLSPDNSGADSTTDGGWSWGDSGTTSSPAGSTTTSTDTAPTPANTTTTPAPAPADTTTTTTPTNTSTTTAPTDTTTTPTTTDTTTSTSPADTTTTPTTTDSTPTTTSTLPTDTTTTTTDQAAPTTTTSTDPSLTSTTTTTPTSSP